MFSFSHITLLTQLSIHLATFLTKPLIQIDVFIWRGERGGPSGHLVQTLQVIWPPSILSDPGAEHRRCSGHVNPAAVHTHSTTQWQTTREPAFSLRHWLHVASVTRHWYEIACSRCFQTGGKGEQGSAWGSVENLREN